MYRECFICDVKDCDRGYSVLYVDTRPLELISPKSIVLIYVCYPCWNTYSDESARRYFTLSEWLDFAGEEWRPFFVLADEGSDSVVRSDHPNARYYIP